MKYFYLLIIFLIFNINSLNANVLSTKDNKLTFNFNRNINSISIPFSDKKSQNDNKKKSNIFEDIHTKSGRELLIEHQKTFFYVGLGFTIGSGLLFLSALPISIAAGIVYAAEGVGSAAYLGLSISAGILWGMLMVITLPISIAMWILYAYSRKEKTKTTYNYQIENVIPEFAITIPL